MYYFVLEFDFRNKKDSPTGKRYDARLLLEPEFSQWQEEIKDRTPGKNGEPKVSFERYSNREYALDVMVEINEKNTRAFEKEEARDARIENFKIAVREEIVGREREYSKKHIADFPYYVEIKTLNPNAINETKNATVLLPAEAAKLFYFDTYYEPFEKSYTNVTGAKTLNDALKVAFDFEKKNSGGDFTLEQQGKFLEQQRNRILKLAGHIAKQNSAPHTVKAFYNENGQIGKIVCYQLSPRNHPCVATIIEVKAKQNFLFKVLSGNEPKMMATQTFASEGDARNWILSQGLKEISSSGHLNELQISKYKDWIELFD